MADNNIGIEYLAEMDERTMELVLARLRAISHAAGAMTDSLEIGTPGRGGAVKIYGNFGSPDVFKIRIDNAMAMRDHAIKAMELKED